MPDRQRCFLVISRKTHLRISILLEKSIFPVSPEDIPEEHSYHYTNCFNESLAASNNSYGTRQKYQMNFSVTGVLEKNAITSNSQRIKYFLHFQLV